LEPILMEELAIRVDNLSKRYRIGKLARRGERRHALLKRMVDPFRYLATTLREPDPDEIFWALRDVSFDVYRGEVVGVIGRNGAGKSTLLKMLSRITEPTGGKAFINGRVGSLLEVGTGFHPELTGRENVYLNGAILGMKKSEIDKKFDEIVAFAEVEKFIDTPVKRYSSGMYVRLAFAVAAHLETEILLVDEVLAVGDVSFQEKCLGKMGDVARQGRTVLFVSHNLGAVRQLCQRAVLLESGSLALNGGVTECIIRYLAHGAIESGEIIDHVEETNPAVEVDSIFVNGSTRDELRLPTGDNEITLEISGRVKEQIHLELEARIFDLYETPLAFFSPGHSRGYTPRLEPGPFHLVHTMKLPDIMQGEYYLSLYLTEPGLAYWVKIPQAVRVLAEGTPTATGHVFEYYKGAGWVLLPEIEA
jgi:lipopolysaccharide transport system ATP-binding protein